MDKKADPFGSVLCFPGMKSLSEGSSGIALSFLRKQPVSPDKIFWELPSSF